jgi:hypothetical protein
MGSAQRNKNRNEKKGEEKEEKERNNPQHRRTHTFSAQKTADHIIDIGRPVQESSTAHWKLHRNG